MPHVFVSYAKELPHDVVEEFAPSKSNSGETTRSEKELVEDICKEVKAMGLQVSLSSEEFPVGDVSFYFVIISKNYLESCRCKNELSLIQRISRGGSRIVPIFYHVEPAQLRYPRKDCTDAFVQYKEKRSKEKLNEWKEALSSVTDYNGHIVKSDEDVLKLLKKIPDWVAKNVEKLPPVLEEFASDNTKSSIPPKDEKFLKYMEMFLKHARLVLEELYLKYAQKILKLELKRNLKLEHKRKLRKLFWIGLTDPIRRGPYVYLVLFSDNDEECNWCLKRAELEKCNENIHTLIRHVKANDVGSVHQEFAESEKSNVDMPVRDDCHVVFINHRGPDVKRTVAKEIYTILKDGGLKPFLDSEELEWGDHFPSVLENVMGSAKLHIAIISEHYAESKWCLQELSFMRKTGARIIPIIYHCKLKDVRRATGVFVDGFRKFIKERRCTLKTIQLWKDALSRVTSNGSYIINNEEDLNMLLKNITYVSQEILNAKTNKRAMTAFCGWNSSRWNSIRNLTLFRL